MLPCDFYPASEEYADFILRYSSRSPEALYELAKTSCVNLISQEFAVSYGRLDQLSPISVARYTYSVIPKLYGLLDTTALEDAEILPVLRQPALNASGQGVLIGFIDTGIDYTCPLFRRPDGGSRILSIWDQTIQGEEAPEAVVGFQPFYGTVYRREQIDEALRSQDPLSLVPTRDLDGHGTFMAGVAAGNQTEEPVSFSGAAPDAVIAAVKLKPAKQYLRDFFLIPPGAQAFQENDIMAAVSYLLGLANEHQMPLVIYLGVGTSQGGHDGSSPLSLQLQSLIGTRGLSVVVGAGNEAGYHHHFLGEIPADAGFQDVELRIGQKEAGFCLELWAAEPELYTVGFVSPAGEVIDRIPLILGNEAMIPFQLDDTRISLVYESQEAGSGSQLIFMRFEAPSPGIWHIRVYPSVSISGRFHMWLPMHGFVSEETVFLRPDPDTTVADPGNAPMPITAGAYNHGNGSIYIHSSRGYTRSGFVKPDLAAPGVQVQGPFPSRGTITDGETRFTRRTGSSVSAAVTAGAAACILSWGYTERNDETLTGTSVKAMLIRGARRIPAFSWPNRQWGYGALNLYQSFLSLRE